MRAEAERRWKELEVEEGKQQEESKGYQKGGKAEGEGKKASYFGEVSEATLWANGMNEDHRLQMAEEIEGDETRSLDAHVGTAGDRDRMTG